VPTQEFKEQLVSFLPKMRTWALALTRNAAAADDLVQEVAAKALSGSDGFVPGSNFKAWLHRIMMNHFISSVRSRRNMVDVDEVPDVCIGPSHEDRTALRELSWAVNRLPSEQRQALLMIAIDEDSYESVSKRTGCAIGTLKSRVHRARLQLRALAA
jgi:RNA polymerase sigma-70 factor, ECF subfamily